MDEPYQLLTGQGLRGLRPGRVGDPLLHNRAIDVIDAKGLTDLGHLQAQHDPEALDVVEVVEGHPSHGEGPKVLVA